MILHPPAKCGKCGLVFHATGIAVSNSTNVTMTGNSQSCPRCGHMANIGDGVYDFIGDRVKLIDGPPATIEMLEALAQTVRDSIAAGEAPEKTIERIGAIDPRILRFKKFAGAAVLAIGALVDWASRINTGLDVYNALTGHGAQQEYSQQVQAAKEGSLLAIEEFYGTKEYQDFKRRLDEQESAPPPPKPASGSPSLKIHPMLIEFPITAQKLADYEKNRRIQN